MNVKRILLLCALSLPAPAVAVGQGFAGLGSSAEGFSIPQRGVAPTFPRDHGPHPDFRVEWWYVTANLQTAGGEQLGVNGRSFARRFNRVGAPDGQIRRYGWGMPPSRPRAAIMLRKDWRGAALGRRLSKPNRSKPGSTTGR